MKTAGFFLIFTLSRRRCEKKSRPIRLRIREYAKLALTCLKVGKSAKSLILYITVLWAESESAVWRCLKNRQFYKFFMNTGTGRFVD